MRIRSSNVMAYILHKAAEYGHPLNRTQAQKVLYACYGMVMAATNKRLTDEHPRAWPYGVVFPRTINDINKKRLTKGMALDFPLICPPDVIGIIDKTVRKFCTYTGAELATWSCRAKSPWAKADPLAALDDREIGLFFEQILPEIDKPASSSKRC